MDFGAITAGFVPEEETRVIERISNHFRSPSFRSFMLNRWVVTALTGLISTFIVACIAATLLSNAQPVGVSEPQIPAAEQTVKPVVDPQTGEARPLNLQDAANNETVTRENTLREIVKTDMNPVAVTNPGYLQRAWLAEAANIPGRIQQQQRANNANNSEHPAIIRQRMEADALRMITAGAHGKDMAVRWVDPETKKYRVDYFSPEMLVALGQLKLATIRASERPNSQRLNLVEAAVDTAATIRERKDSKATLLRTQGMTAVANKLDAYDEYGKLKQQNPEDAEWWQKQPVNTQPW